MTGYYADDLVTLYHGDCRDDPETWASADLLITDPPYGRNWKARPMKSRHSRGMHSGRIGITGDTDTQFRDQLLKIWEDVPLAPVRAGRLNAGRRPAIMFGDLMLPAPAGTKLVSTYLKPPDAGTRGAIAGHRRDVEAIYWIGGWPSSMGGRSSIYTTTTPSAGNPSSPAGKYGHPHAKPVDMLEALLTQADLQSRALFGNAPPDIADPCAGSGSILVAARNLGLTAVGWEIEEQHCETTARRLEQMALQFPLGGTT